MSLETKPSKKLNICAAYVFLHYPTALSSFIFYNPFEPLILVHTTHRAPELHLGPPESRSTGAFAPAHHWRWRRHPTQLRGALPAPPANPDTLPPYLAWDTLPRRRIQPFSLPRQWSTCACGSPIASAPTAAHPRRPRPGSSVAAATPISSAAGSVRCPASPLQHLAWLVSGAARRSGRGGAARRDVHGVSSLPNRRAWADPPPGSGRRRGPASPASPASSRRPGRSSLLLCSPFPPAGPSMSFPSRDVGRTGGGSAAPSGGGGGG
jgi:hypothetical protein